MIRSQKKIQLGWKGFEGQQAREPLLATSSQPLLGWLFAEPERPEIARESPTPLGAGVPEADFPASQQEEDPGRYHQASMEQGDQLMSWWERTREVERGRGEPELGDRCHQAQVFGGQERGQRQQRLPENAKGEEVGCCSQELGGLW